MCGGDRGMYDTLTGVVHYDVTVLVLGVFT